ncbi:hypothetical protein Syun_004784 [Stephania yunnanensis]|uniref:Nucleoside diphosphate kinase-like domain-containing protein n=1 Tax=Stephania yunnanensis TaxID=152371 RepID=A0AAP0Q156_9MAGN
MMTVVVVVYGRRHWKRSSCFCRVPPTARRDKVLCLDMVPPVHTSIRALCGTDKTLNCVHGSDSHKSASREIGFFFGTMFSTAADAKSKELHSNLRSLDVEHVRVLSHSAFTTELLEQMRRPGRKDLQTSSVLALRLAIPMENLQFLGIVGTIELEMTSQGGQEVAPSQALCALEVIMLSAGNENFTVSSIRHEEYGDNFRHDENVHHRGPGMSGGHVHSA